MTKPQAEKWPTWLGAKLRRAAREPMAQFLVVAVVLFAANSVFDNGEGDGDPAVVVIAQGRVEQLAESYRLLAGRVPSRAEMETLLVDLIDEEIAYREAVALGLDRDDTIVRRRMRQKLEFLAEDDAAIEEPSDADLTAWLSDHAADYMLPERVSFRHVLASHDKRGAQATADAQTFFAELKSGLSADGLGDASMLPSVVALSSKESVMSLFGAEFAGGIFAQEGEEWFGPIRSPYGVHLVRITSREAARLPELAEVRAKVRSDWIEVRRQTARQSTRARLRERYDVRVEWPELYTDQGRTGGGG